MFVLVFVSKNFGLVKILACCPLELTKGACHSLVGVKSVACDNYYRVRYRIAECTRAITDTFSGNVKVNVTEVHKDVPSGSPPICI